MSRRPGKGKMEKGEEPGRGSKDPLRVRSESPPSEEKSALDAVRIISICILAGLIFGFCSEKGRVFDPHAIRLQMVFEKWIMLKMFLGAMAASMVCFAIISLIPRPFFQQRFLSAQAYERDLASKNALAIACGAFLLGVGMSLGGACPGMVLPQVGAWVHQAIFTLIGAFLGALAYGLLHDAIYEKIFPSHRFTLPSSFMKLVKVQYAAVALPLASTVITVIVLLEVYVPWKKDVEWGFYYDKSSYVLARNWTGWNVTYQSAPSIFQLLAWPPSLCGVFIGLMQMVLVMGAGQTLGGSSAYCTIVSLPFLPTAAQRAFPYLANFQRGFDNWWQVIYVGSAVAGGAISSALSQTIGLTPGVPLVYALCGGFCLVFGARLAAGCTSGHGLSGCGLLILGSFLAVPCMFAGGIATAFIMKFGTHHLYWFCDRIC